MRNRKDSKSDTVKTEQIRSSTEAYGESLKEGVFRIFYMLYKNLDIIMPKSLLGEIT